MKATNQDESKIDVSSLRSAFLMTMRKQAEGVLTKYLFGASWDQNISKSRFYSVANDEIEAISFALDHGLLDQLPRAIQFLEYGVGGDTGVSKPKRLITALIAAGFRISSYIAIDTEERYVQESSSAIAEEFNTNSRDQPRLQTQAIVGDFMSESKINVPPPLPGVVPLIAVFGRTLSNAPDLRLSGGKDSQENCADYIALMKDRHSNGITEELYLLMTYHEETNSNSLLKEYAATPEMTAFILGIFPKVVKHGIITDRDYLLKDYWRMIPLYDDANHVIKLCAMCLVDHVMPTIEGDIHIKVGDQFVHVLSSKWDGQLYEKICRGQGASEIKFYKDPTKPTGVMLAQFSLRLKST